MNPSEGLSRIISEIFEATLRPHAWERVSDLIANRYGATAFMVFEYDLENHRSPTFFGSEWMRNLGSSLVEALQNGEGDEDLQVYRNIARLEPCRLFGEYQILGCTHDDNIQSNAFRNRVLIAAGSKSRNASRLNEIGPWLDIAALHMPCLSVDVPFETLDEMNLLLPIIRKALETGRVIRNLTLNYGFLLDVFDRLDFGVAFCTSDGRILMANRCMRDALRDRDAVVAKGGRLEAVVAGDRPRLHRVLADTHAHAAAPRDLWLQLERRSGRTPLVVKVAPIRTPEVAEGDEQVACILIADPEDDSRIHAEGLAAFGLLSPAELDVCRLLLRGADVREIAERRSTSIETARGQIKSAAAKMGCHKRLDLLRIAMATSLPRSQPGKI